MTQIVRADRKGIEQAAGVLLKGGIIAYPTETVYGLGGIAFNAAATAGIRRLKGRDENKPMLVLLPGADILTELVRPVPEAYRLTERFWPGPLTLIFQAVPGFLADFTGPEGGLGVRVSPDPACRALMDQLDTPLISTSANPAGSPPACSAGDADAYFGDRLDLVLDDGPRNRTAPSTVVDTRTIPFRILREGAVDIRTLKQAAGELFE